MRPQPHYAQKRDEFEQFASAGDYDVKTWHVDKEQSVRERAYLIWISTRREDSIANWFDALNQMEKEKAKKESTEKERVENGCAFLQEKLIQNEKHNCENARNDSLEQYETQLQFFQLLCASNTRSLQN